MKNLFFLLLMVLLFGCANKKAVYNSKELKHRYAKVYEGNRIITYTKAESNFETGLPVNETSQLQETAESQAPLINKSGTEKSHHTKSISRSNADLVSLPVNSSQKTDFYKSKPKQRDRVKGGAGGHEGLIAFILMILGILLTFVVTGGAVYFVLLLGLISLIMAIIGVVKKNNRTDLIFAEIVLWINVISALLVVLIVLFQL